MCVIFYININGQIILAKNRDRPYKPEIEIIHEIKNGIEVVYMKDSKHGWIEGMNELGNGMVNSTLIDEIEDYSGYNLKKNKMYNALIQKNKNNFFNEFLKKSDNKYILEGHTLFVVDNNVYHLENNLKNNYFLESIKSNKLFDVYSNHGINLPKEGEIDGIDGISSVIRREIVIKEINNLLKHKKDIKCNDNKLYNKISSIINKNYVNINNKFHPYRKTTNLNSVKNKNMYYNSIIPNTTSQIFLNITNKEFVYFQDKINSEKVTYVNKLPKKYLPKLRVIIKETEKNMEPVKIFNNEYLNKVFKRFNYDNKTRKNKTCKNKTRKNKLDKK
jgi:hypothetical protein